MPNLLSSVVNALRAGPPQPPARPTPGEDRMIRFTPRDRTWESLSRTVLPADIEVILWGALQGDLSFQDDLFTRMEEGWDRLAKNLNEVRRAVARARYVVQPHARKGAKPSPAAVAKAALVEEALFSMRPDPTRWENAFEDTLYDLTDALGRGLSVVEVYWEARPGVGIVPRATRHVPARYYGFPAGGEVEDRLMLNRKGYNVGQGAELEDFPPDKFLIGLARNRSGHPSRTALLRPLAHLWVMRTFSERWLANYAEIFGMPIRWAKYDQSNRAILPQIEAMLENLGSAGWGAFPTGTELELKEPTGRAADNPQAYLREAADRACDILILGQTLTSDVGNSGSRALGDVHNAVRHEVLLGGASWCADVLTRQLVPSLVRLNFGDDAELPFILPDVPAPVDAKGQAERDKILFVDMGLPVERAFLYERHNVPQPAEDADPSALFQPAAPAGGPAGAPGMAATAADEDEAGDDGTEEGNPSQTGDLEGRPVAARAATRGGSVGQGRPSSPPSRILVEARRRATAGRLSDAVMEGLTGVSAEWLAPARPVFAALIEKALDEKVTDEDFMAAVATAARTMPELFGRLKTEAVADALEKAMGAAVANGAIRGWEETVGRQPRAEGGKAP